MFSDFVGQRHVSGGYQQLVLELVILQRRGIAGVQKVVAEGRQFAQAQIIQEL